MDCRYLIVSSVTYAMKAKDVLKKQGISSKIEKIKNISKLNGCGYGVKVSEHDLHVALRFLNIAGITIIDISDCEANSR